ncbi:penicillin amidase [Deinococcus metalli]|uniref:Penicillin amidase n=1 Tax=Deinococcus metalli TaxID=1141878 RepID=A0A7W8NNC8_9DEIO|nr:penicillin acylase family protein [Deinococcus metalli]MBB5374570.1 penicillin amidase [Deinococcus metalli]GHF35292.1 penicillin amidase [Deinococcus metalli]
MATGRVTRSGARRGVWARRLGWGVAWAVLVLLALLLAAVLWLRATSVPRVSGTLRVPGVQGPVTVTRDTWGVPHIRAASDEDAMYALGFVHWQDRAWQMEFQRRVAQGRLSEVLGAAALPQDRFLRTWGFQRAAVSALPALEPRTRRLVSAYTAGVNAAMRQGKVAVEFRVLGFTPGAWTDVDSLSWSKLMAYDLGGNMDDEVLGSRVVKRLGTSGLAQVTAPYPAGAPTILSADEVGQERPTPAGPSGSVLLPDAALTALRTHLAAAAALGMQPVPGKGSNDWVVAGRRTASGKPILADDPHLALTSPMLWYLADVQGSTLHAIGASIPGLPGIVIGRNDRVAWGVTNVNPDVQDLYVEPASVTLTSRTEVIKVKGAPDVSLVVQESAHGPIVSGAGAAGVGERVALKWTALQPGDTTMDAFLNLNYARNWTDFTAALSRYVAPSQNFVYADVDGNTGYYAPGRVPIRRGWDGSLPVAGDGAHEWAGYVPFAQLPHTLNPADGLVVTANNKVMPDSAMLGTARNWAEPYRAERITQLLQAKPTGLSVADVQRVQLDTTSSVWRDFRAALLKTVPDGEASARALDLLRTWDGAETVDSVPATIFEAWMMQLQTMAQDELADSTVMNSLSVLNQLRSDGELCRDEAAGVADCAGELRVTLKAAVADITARLGSDPAKWTYGRLHAVASTHRAFGGVPALAWLFNHSAPTPGGTNTVNVARPEAGTFRQTHGPSYRQIIDLANPDASVYTGSLGQSGNPLGNHVSDQQPRWIAGQYLPMSTRPADWGRTATLTLQPAP